MVRRRLKFRRTERLTGRPRSSLCHIHALSWYLACIAAGPARSPAESRCSESTWVLTF
jgi:hypothetical protein